uniref:DUF3615 domain-containing protein n=1 Tax=Leersia perrieri TaxID=77586 RepID=A0A0D9VNB8_9ORYZ
MSMSASAAAEEERRHLLGGRAQPAPGLTAEKAKAVAAAIEKHERRRERAYARARSPCGLPFPFFSKELLLDTTRPGVPITADQSKRLRQEKDTIRRYMQPGRFQRLAMDRKFVLQCLKHYNAMHPDDEYEPAPGKVTKHFDRDNGITWTHGNFVARRKRTGCFSILPAPRILFFFELMSSSGFEGVVTCTPLDEAVTEAYSIMGFPLWWSSRRSGRLDGLCKTCFRHFNLPHPFIRKTFACGHNQVERVCEMCYFSSEVLHPFPGEFAYGYREYKYRYYY